MNDLAKSFFISVLNANVSLHVAEVGPTLGLLVTSTPTAAEAPELQRKLTVDAGVFGLSDTCAPALDVF